MREKVNWGKWCGRKRVIYSERGRRQKWGGYGYGFEEREKKEKEMFLTDT